MQSCIDRELQVECNYVDVKVHPKASLGILSVHNVYLEHLKKQEVGCKTHLRSPKVKNL